MSSIFVGDRGACYPGIVSLPELVDCAVLAIPAESAEEVARSCARARCGAIVVLASGVRC